MENKVKLDISTGTILKVAGIILGIWFLYAIREVVVLFFIVLVIVAALGPLVDKMSKYIPRLLALIILTTVFFSLVTLVGYLLVPPILEQLRNLATNLPFILDQLGPFYQNLRDSIVNYQEGLLNLTNQFGRLTTGMTR